MKDAKVALTTIDNPFNPFKDFDKWFSFDVEKGYNTCSYLARVSETSDAFTDEENEKRIEDAIDLIISYDFTNLYKKIKNT